MSPLSAFNEYLDKAFAYTIKERELNFKYSKPGAIFNQLSEKVKESLKSLNSKDLNHRIDWELK